MDHELKGRKALVLGGNGGLATATALADQITSVAIADFNEASLVDAGLPRRRAGKWAASLRVRHVIVPPSI
jgi:NAD(P)-dependent dehydrogenase (short-subunit alcohol dehydrogenase family)